MTEKSGFRAGFIAIIGRPNVGKSTLVNSLLGQKVAAVSHRPQTTRRQQLGILTTDSAQLVFVDTPGIHTAQHGLGRRMNSDALDALSNCDAILVIVDGSLPPSSEDQLIADNLKQMRTEKPMVMAINKVDKRQFTEEEISAYKALFPTAACLSISAQNGKNLDSLLSMLAECLPEHPPFFPGDQITDYYEREIAADLIREATLLLLRDEVPHSIAVRVDEFTERGDTGAYIAATLFVERDSQLSIVIGSKGEMIKKIGIQARKSIETMSGRKVHLELRVKVRKNWRNDPKTLEQFEFKSRGRK